jgi:hypothetical protein
MAAPTYHPLQSQFDSIYISISPLTTYEEIGGSEVDEYYIESSIGDTEDWQLVH